MSSNQAWPYMPPDKKKPIGYPASPVGEFKVINATREMDPLTVLTTKGWEGGLRVSENWPLEA